MDTHYQTISHYNDRIPQPRMVPAGRNIILRQYTAANTRPGQQSGYRRQTGHVLRRGWGRVRVMYCCGDGESENTVFYLTYKYKHFSQCSHQIIESIPFWTFYNFLFRYRQSEMFTITTTQLMYSDSYPSGDRPSYGVRPNLFSTVSLAPFANNQVDKSKN